VCVHDDDCIRVLFPFPSKKKRDKLIRGSDWRRESESVALKLLMAVWFVQVPKENGNHTYIRGWVEGLIWCVWAHRLGVGSCSSVVVHNGTYTLG